MRRIEQVNELIKTKLAILISREMPLENGMVTISYVDCSPDLKHAKIGFSVLPENKFGSVLEKLKKLSSVFSNILKKETRLRKIPRFNWVIDDREKIRGEFEEILTADYADLR